MLLHQALHRTLTTSRPILSLFKSKIDTNSPEFVENASKMSLLISHLKETVANIKLGGGTEARNRHIARNKMVYTPYIAR